MDITQINDAFPVQTARHDRPVHENGRLGAKRMAEAFAVILRCRQARPLEFVVLVQVDVLGHLHATAGLHLFLDAVVEIKFLLQNFKRLAVSLLLQVRLVVLRQIPQAEGEDHIMLLGIPYERENVPQISLTVRGADMAVKAVEREVHLP